MLTSNAYLLGNYIYSYISVQEDHVVRPTHTEAALNVLLDEGT